MAEETLRKGGVAEEEPDATVAADREGATRPGDRSGAVVDQDRHGSVSALVLSAEEE